MYVNQGNLLKNSQKNNDFFNYIWYKPSKFSFLRGKKGYLGAKKGYLGAKKAVAPCKITTNPKK